MRKELRKSNSTGTLFIRTTLSRPHTETIIASISHIIHSQILEDTALKLEVPMDSDLVIFTDDYYLKDRLLGDDDLEQRLMMQEMPTVD